MRVEYHPQTAADLNTAVAHFNGLQAGLGDALRAEVYGAIDRILFNPEQHRVVENEIRRCFVHRFPYSVSSVPTLLEQIQLVICTRLIRLGYGERK